MTRPHLPTRAVLVRRAATVLAAGSVLASGAALLAPSAQADSGVQAGGGAFVVQGAGFGHGHGMSQYGAYGAARSHLTWQQILAFYYPGTTPETLSLTTNVKVWVTADTDQDLTVAPAAGLRVSDSHHHHLTLPTGARYRAWRITRSGSGSRIAWRSSAGSYTTLATPLDPSSWGFSTKSKVVTVVMPSGSTREYRGSVALVKRGSGGRTVNKVRLDDYVRSVVPSEMPTSWAPDAVRAQAVAARTFALRTRDTTRHSGYDLCDTNSCQVYSGRASTSTGGRRTVHETANGNAATKATARRILTYGGKAALTQFGSSNGGATASGGLPYLRAKVDPYDGAVTSQGWSRTITAAAVGRAYPSAGTVRMLEITKRDGTGRWGGRVVTIRVVGSKKTVSVSGASFQGRFGLRSTLYRVAG